MSGYMRDRIGDKSWDDACKEVKRQKTEHDWAVDEALVRDGR
jgi:hypothetical protein